ncbi:hypothetical protein HOE22_01840 [Candidatus Woesearchaeota archaeon]|mgnify:FL=1|nr:hypothetical protein [Candidatus Woesearchaeota archaeon]
MSKTKAPVKRKKKPKSYYFHIGTEKAIIRYNKTDDARLKNIIYTEHIAKAFDKLAENIIHTFKFYYFDVSSIEVKHEVVSFLVMNMHKFKEGKGKAFSYFSIVAKNYLILHNNKNYKNYKIHSKMEVLDYGSNINKKQDEEEYADFNNAYVTEMLEYWENNLTNIFRRQKDILVADAVLEMFRRRANIENFNKKALYIFIREMTGSKTQHITRIVNLMKKYNTRLMAEFHKLGYLDTANTGSFL